MPGLEPKHSWFAGEDTSHSGQNEVDDADLRPSLSSDAVTRTAAIHVLDVTSGAGFQSDLSADPGSSIRCAYLSSDYAVGTRRDLNGILLLEPALQLPVTKQDDSICVELPLPDAIHLNQCLLGADLPGVDHVMDVVRLLDKEISTAQEAAKHNHKLAKWSTVCLKMSHATLKTIFSSLLAEGKRLQQNMPALPVVSALLDRLNYLLVSAQSDSNQMVSEGTADQALMCSEAARLETFSKWPHLNYKWALPEPMAQAGFYYQPSTTGDDRAVCFVCNVCLVCWEPTDEPWSEHERHSPQCPFVKGEFTQNVPVSVTCATEPAQLHWDQTEKIECLSTSSSSKLFATSNSKGDIVVWNSSSQLKKHVTFEVELQNPVIISKLGAIGSQMTLQSVVTTAREKDAQDKLSDQSSSSATANLLTENTIHQVATTSKESSELHVPPEETASLAGHRTASSLKVTALSVIVGSPSELGASHVGVAVPRTTQDLADVHPSLVAGVFIQVSSPAKDQSPVALATAWQTDRSKFSEVQVLNQSNQAISGETLTPVQIICSTVVNNQEGGGGGGSACDAGVSTSSGENVTTLNQQFIPCLVIYDVSAAVAPSVTVRELKNEPTTTTTFHGTQVTKPEFTDGLSSAIQSVYSIKDVEMSDDDQDIQIIGVSGSVSPTAPKIINLTYDSIPGTTSKVFESNFHQSKESKVKETEITDVVCRSGSLMSAGNVIQCIPLPPEVESTQFVRCIVPLHNKSHIIVITSPVATREDVSCFAQSVVNPGEGRSCVLVYQVVVESSVTLLNADPVSLLQFDDLDDAVMTATLLPTEVYLQSDDGDNDATFANPLGFRAEGLCGAVVITTYSGDIKILNLSDLSVLAVIKATSEEAYVSTTFCSSIDRLCASTRDGRLRFFIVGPKQRHLDELDGGHVCLNSFAVDDSESGACGSAPLVEQKTSTKQENCLLNEQLTVDALTALHDLTQFENLLPRFSATVPPCWNEIQQDQQQRKQPQHLHQQGEATPHPRTWRLQADSFSTSWDEHLFELVLPRLLCVGHIDLKFTLNAMCTSVPNIQVTLLKQSDLSSIEQSDLSSASAANPLTTDAGAWVDFSLDSDVGSHDGVGGSQATDELNGDISGYCLGSEFLEHRRSEIVCGPLELANYVDLSGTQGIIPLTSIQLLKCKSKSFLLHIKSKSTARERATAKSSQVQSQSPEEDANSSDNNNNFAGISYQFSGISCSGDLPSQFTGPSFFRQQLSESRTSSITPRPHNFLLPVPNERRPFLSHLPSYHSLKRPWCLLKPPELNMEDGGDDDDDGDDGQVGPQLVETRQTSKKRKTTPKRRKTTPKRRKTTPKRRKKTQRPPIQDARDVKADEEKNGADAEDEDDDWLCSNCQSHNDASYLTCFQCKHLRRQARLQPPITWEPVVKTSPLKLVQLLSDNPEYVRFMNMADSCHPAATYTFLQGLVRRFFWKEQPEKNIKLLEVWSIQNLKSFQGYDLRKNHVMDKNGPDVINEQELFHGTTAEGARAICEYSFNRSFCGLNGTLYGNGSYFSNDLSYSTNDTYAKPDGNGIQHLIVAKVLTGRYTAGSPSLPEPPVLPEGFGRYDTVVDDVKQPKIFVTFHDFQALAFILLKFRTV